MRKHFKSIKFLEIFDEKDSIENQVKFLRNSIQNIGIEDREKIISYLKSGQMILFRPQIVADVLSEKEEWIGSTSIYSDGVWLWKDYLVHYLEKYNIQIPPEFILHAERNNWQSPKISSEREEKITDEILELSLIQESSN